VLRDVGRVRTGPPGAFRSCPILRRCPIATYEVPIDPQQLTVKRCGTATIIALGGELDLSTAPQISAAVGQLVNGSEESVVLDLSEVEFLDSAGVHAVLGIVRHAAAKDVRLVVLPAAPAVHAPFVLTGMEAHVPFVGGGSV
jgi:anti-sigma B factor antagonist